MCPPLLVSTFYVFLRVVCCGTVENVKGIIAKTHRALGPHTNDQIRILLEQIETALEI